MISTGIVLPFSKRKVDFAVSDLDSKFSSNLMRKYSVKMSWVEWKWQFFSLRWVEYKLL